MFFNSYKAASTFIIKRTTHSWRMTEFLNHYNPTLSSKHSYLSRKFHNTIILRLKDIHTTSYFCCIPNNFNLPIVVKCSVFVLPKILQPALTYIQCAASQGVTHLTELKEYPCAYLSVLCKIWDILLTFLRAIRHGCILLPLLVLFPLTMNSKLRFLWYKLLVLSLEMSGPIFIKLGQWASTRRDIFSKELCFYLSVLQTKNSPHSWFYTVTTLERAFGPDWHQFIKLDNTVEPIGCGCCGQVYKAWIKPDMKEDFGKTVTSSRGYIDELENSFLVEVLEMFGIGHLLSAYLPTYLVDPDECKYMEPVAVKVVHPRMKTLLRRDLIIMKTAANLLTWTIPSFKWLSLPECVDDFAKLMQSQVNLEIEADNLEAFAANFSKIKNVRFPQPIRSLSTSYLLTQTFEDGIHMNHFATTPQPKELKAKLADIGINTILKMVFTDNLIHGDLHPGNMLVREIEPSRIMELIYSWLNIQVPKPVGIVILDCGITIALKEREKQLLRSVFTNVASGDGQKVADLFLENSTHQCSDTEAFRRSITELVDTSHRMGVTLHTLAVSSLMTQVFTTMIQNKVKIDGCFSSVILAVMVVEGLGRSLDPTIDMVEKARPFLFSPYANWKHRRSFPTPTSRQI